MTFGLRSVLRAARDRLRPTSDGFLTDVHGVVHVGANVGQERHLYGRRRLPVIWVEPIPDVFDELRRNVAAFPGQRAVNCLVTDKDDEPYTFHIANNRGESSSILPLGLHRDIWPAIDFERAVTLRSRTLATLLRAENVALGDFDALVIDAQGAELLVLQGAVSVLAGFTYIKVEVPDFEAYVGCCQVADVARFLDAQGFEECSRHPFAERQGGGRYYDIVYKRAVHAS